MTGRPYPGRSYQHEDYGDVEVRSVEDHSGVGLLVGFEVAGFDSARRFDEPLDVFVRRLVDPPEDVR